MNIALQIANMSYAERKKVGSLIVKDDNILSYGWNGTPRGCDNKCEENGQTKKEVLHAELNSLMKLARSGSVGSCNGATLYVSLSPCFDCAKLIVQSGIKRVVYLEEYRDTEPLLFLQQFNIEIKKLRQNEEI